MCSKVQSVSQLQGSMNTGFNRLFNLFLLSFLLDFWWLIWSYTWVSCVLQTVSPCIFPLTLCVQFRARIQDILPDLPAQHDHYLLRWLRGESRPLIETRPRSLCLNNNQQRVAVCVCVTSCWRASPIVHVQIKGVKIWLTFCGWCKEDWISADIHIRESSTLSCRQM